MNAGVRVQGGGDSLAAGVVDLEGDVAARHHADRCADD